MSNQKEYGTPYGIPYGSAELAVLMTVGHHVDAIYIETSLSDPSSGAKMSKLLAISRASAH